MGEGNGGWGKEQETKTIRGKEEKKILILLIVKSKALNLEEKLH